MDNDDKIKKLRQALVGLMGIDGKDSLYRMEIMIRKTTPKNDPYRKPALAAIGILLKTLPE